MKLLILISLHAVCVHILSHFVFILFFRLEIIVLLLKLKAMNKAPFSLFALSNLKLRKFCYCSHFSIEQSRIRSGWTLYDIINWNTFFLELCSTDYWCVRHRSPGIQILCLKIGIKMKRFFSFWQPSFLSATILQPQGSIQIRNHC